MALCNERRKYFLIQRVAIRDFPGGNQWAMRPSGRNHESKAQGRKQALGKCAYKKYPTFTIQCLQGIQRAAVEAELSIKIVLYDQCIPLCRKSQKCRSPASETSQLRKGIGGMA